MGEFVIGEMKFDQPNRFKEYQGEFENGVPNGLGQAVMSNEVKLRGRFLDGQFESGIVYYTNGEYELVKLVPIKH